MDFLASIWTWQVALVAFAVAFGLTRLGHRWTWLAGLSAGAGVLAGWWMVLGLPTASPRQLAERLPLLMAAMLVLALLLAPLARFLPRCTPALVFGSALVAGWWMAGAPRTVPDLLQAAPVLLGVAALVWALAHRAGPRSVPLAAAALLAGLVAANSPGAQMLLGAVVVAASLGAIGQGPKFPALQAIPVSAALAAVAVLPIIARAAPADWAAAAAPLAVLWLAPLLAARWRGRTAPALCAILVAAPFVAAAAILR